MNWISTVSGVQFHFLDPRAKEVVIEDIAHSLAWRCRFNGHTKVYYSIAQHSVLVAECLCEMFPNDRAIQLWGLLHDAAEAYLPDVPGPIKPYLRGFDALEERILQVITAKYGLIYPPIAAVKLADRQALIIEGLVLFGREIVETWEYKITPPESIQLVPMTAEESKKAFLDKFNELTS